jgi:uncharacterized glyoxalase superfamily protein PhnB
VPGLNAVGIVSANVTETLRFYRLLGADFGDAAGDGHVEAAMPNGLRLMVDSEEIIHSFDPGWQRSTGNQLSLAFECASPSEVDETYAKVVEAGFHGEKEPWDAFWGQRYAQLRDPDGVPVDLFAANPSN